MWLHHDLAAGFSVFFVALPLCLGIALASGAPLYAGLLSGIIGGLLVSVLSGSNFAVSGPAAGLSTIVAAYIISFGQYPIFLCAVVIAGIFQLIMGLLKLGNIANSFPSSVIKGMLAAIGIILMAKQIPLAIGYDQPDFWSSGFLELFSADQVTVRFNSLNHHAGSIAIAISIISLIVLWACKQPFLKRIRRVPAPLLAVLAGIMVNQLFRLFPGGEKLKHTQLVKIPSHIFSQITFPDFHSLFSNPEIWKAGIVIALLASLETLLCVEAIDKLDRRNRITPVNRELMAQGAGNILCGLLGALPLTAVVVRGAANVDAGAKTKLSSFTHGILLLLSVLLVPALLSKIPYASLAAILLVTGYHLTPLKLYRNMWSLGLKQFLPFIITIIVILATDLLIGVGIGLLISLYFIIQNNFKAEYKITRSVSHATEVYLIKLNSNVTFLNKIKLRQALDQIPAYSILTIDGTASNFIDYDILEIISEYQGKAHEKHIEVHLQGIQAVNVTALH
jgi:MFS superfamily sulfate permease-like transporter